MSTTVQNIVQKHTSVGAKKVQKDTEAIGKAQTRLGQASASAGRQFSAQATGLGGIVSAYAGAAAIFFALTAAFLHYSVLLNLNKSYQEQRDLPQQLVKVVKKF